MLVSCSATASASGFSPQSDPNRSVIHASWTFVAGLAAGLLSSFQTGSQLRPASLVFATPSHLIPPSSKSLYETYAVSGFCKLVATARIFAPAWARLAFLHVVPWSSEANADSSPITYRSGLPSFLNPAEISVSVFANGVDSFLMPDLVFSAMKCEPAMRSIRSSGGE